LLWLPGKCLIIILFRKCLSIDFTLNKLYGQANPLLDLHTQPINLVVYKGPLALLGGKSNLGTSFPLICFQRLSQPNVATQRCPWRDNWYTIGLSVPVLSY